MGRDSVWAHLSSPLTAPHDLGKMCSECWRADKAGHALCTACELVPGPPPQGGGASVEMKVTCLGRAQRPGVLADPMESLQEGGRMPTSTGSCGSRPVSALGGLARVHVQGLQAVLAAHGAAPVELTLALGHPGDAGGVIASPTAHDFTAVHASGSQVAHAACCTQGAWKTSREVSLRRCGQNPMCLRGQSSRTGP